jgi:hypothetical protein
VTNLYSNDGMGTAPSSPDPGQVDRKRPSGRLRVAAVVAACAVAAGGAFAVTEAVSGSSPGTPSPAAAAATGLTGQAAVLNGALADASFASSAQANASYAAAANRLSVRRVRRAIARLRALGGMHGEFTFETKKGPRTLAFERGAVLSVTGDDVTVRAADGTIWTWVLSGSSVVRQDGTRTAATALAHGEQVFTAGSVSGALREALLIVIRQPASPA